MRNASPVLSRVLSNGVREALEEILRQQALKLIAKES